MTSAHIFFIPGMIMIGMFVGFVLGARATRNQLELQRRRDEDRDAARAARAAKRAEAVVETKPSDEPAPAKEASAKPTAAKEPKKKAK